MARLLCSAITSLDGYVADATGSFEWAVPSPELHAAVNQAEASVGTHLFGRRMYEIMQFWETVDDTPDVPGPEREYARLWRDADKVVVSRTLDAVTTARTRLVRELVPDDVRRWKAESDRDLAVGGPGLAAAAFAAGLVDEVRMYVLPVSVGGGTPLLPPGQRIGLELLEATTVAEAVHLRYGVRR